MRPGQGRSANTKTSTAATRAQIEDLLTRYGATGFLAGWQETPVGRVAAISFRLQGRAYRIPVKLPDPNDRAITHVNRGAAGGWKERTPAERKRVLEQRERQAWRNIHDLLIAVLLLVEQDEVKPEQIFLSYLVMPNGCTVGQWVEPQLEEIYQRGGMPALLPGVTE